MSRYAEIKELDKAAKGRKGGLTSFQEDRAYLIDLVARLRVFVDGRSYQPHESDCLSTGELPGTCDCGLDALLDETRA